MDTKNLKDYTLNKSKTIGKSILDTGRNCLKRVKEQPEIIVKPVVAVVTVVVGVVGVVGVVALANVAQSNYECKNNLKDEGENQSLSDSIFNEMTSEDETKTINYPDDRKSPIVHTYHLNGQAYARGGTAQDKEQYRSENPSDFGLELFDINS